MFSATITTQASVAPDRSILFTTLTIILTLSSTTTHGRHSILNTAEQNILFIITRPREVCWRCVTIASHRVSPVTARPDLFIFTCREHQLTAPEAWNIVRNTFQVSLIQLM